MRAFLLGSAVAAAGLMLSGCVSTVASVVTAPVRVAGKAADWATTSQSEADEKRGRELRKREARYGKLSREYQRYAKRCSEDNPDACEEARTIRSEMEDMRGGMPVDLPGDYRN